MSDIDREEYLGYVWTPPSWNPSADAYSLELDSPDLDELYPPLSEERNGDTSMSLTTEVHEGELFDVIAVELTSGPFVCRNTCLSRRVRTSELLEVWGPSLDPLRPVLRDIGTRVFPFPGC
jgi:hypothetical protein